MLVLCLYALIISTATAEVVEKSIEFTTESAWVVLLPDDMNEYGSYPLVVGLHGYGDTALNFSRRWVEENKELDYIFIFPQGPWPFEVSEGAAGFAWCFWYDDELASRCIEGSVEYIYDVITKASAQYPVDISNIYVFGFSQGGQMTYMMAQEYPDTFAGHAVFGGVWDKDHIDMDQLSQTSEKPWLIMHTDGDDVCEPEWAFEKPKAKFEEFGFEEAKFYLYHANGHVMLTEEVQDFKDWLRHNVYWEKYPKIDISLDEFAGGPYPDLAETKDEVVTEMLRDMVLTEWGGENANYPVLLGSLLDDEELSDSTKAETIYVIGALRQYFMDERVIEILNDKNASEEMRTNALHALRKLDTEAARDAIDNLEWAVRVAAVAPDSNAANAGIEAGDIFVKYGGKDVDSRQTLIELLGEFAEEDEIEVVVWRDGDMQMVTVDPGRLGVYLEETIKFY